MIKDARAQRVRERGNEINVFLSHKHHDFAAADQIQKVLMRRGKTTVFMSETIEKGDSWQDRIEQQMYDSDWFILLFSGTNDDWSWCNHEAGLFRGMMYPDAKRIVVLHPSNVDLPDQLKKYQSVKCHVSTPSEPDDFKQLFVDMFGMPPYPGITPINRHFAYEDDEARTEARETIIEAVGRLVVQTIGPSSRFILQIPELDDIKASCFPEGSRILQRSTALSLFNLGDAEFGWPEFQSALADQPELQARLNDRFWPVVCEACLSSVRRRKIAPIYTIFRAPADDRNYHPVLSQINISADKSATFYIDFVQVAGSSQTDVRDKSVARIFTALNLAHRFRWEVIDPYREVDRLQDFVEHQARMPDRQRNGDKAPAGGGLASVWEKIRLIEIEAQNRGVSDDRALPADFGDSARERLAAMSKLWQKKRQQLERAQSSGDVAKFAKVLTELDATNVEFISLACQRLDELVRDDAHDAHGAAQN
jgi:hypothetical protein